MNSLSFFAFTTKLVSQGDVEIPFLTRYFATLYHVYKEEQLSLKVQAWLHENTYLYVQLPLIRCLSTFVFWAEVMRCNLERGDRAKKASFFSPKGNKSSFHQEKSEKWHAFSGNGLSPLPYLPAFWSGSPTGLHPPDAPWPGCVWREQHGFAAYLGLHRLGEEHESQKEAEVFRQIITAALVGKKGGNWFKTSQVQTMSCCRKAQNLF